MRLILIRHAPTAWNEQRRVQGISDQPLSPAGEAAAGSWQLPPTMQPRAWLTSPLLRARQTAACMGLTARIDDRLREMDWGDWEGRTLDDLRRDLGPAMADNEARGLDFTPPGGESPRQVQRRLEPWLADIATTDTDTGIIAHKGVIRALIGLATGWSFLGKPPAPLRHGEAQSLILDGDGTPTLEHASIPLTDGAP